MVNSKLKNNLPLYVLLLVVVVAIVYFLYSSQTGSSYSTSTTAATSAATTLTTVAVSYPTTIVNASSTTITSPSGVGCVQSSSNYTCASPVYSNGYLDLKIAQFTGSNWQSPSIEFFPNSSVNATSPTFNASREYQITGILYSGTQINVTLPLPSGITSGNAKTVKGFVWAQYRKFDTAPVQYAELGTATFVT